MRAASGVLPDEPVDARDRILALAERHADEAVAPPG